MTGRTHDLAAFTALNIAFIAVPPIAHISPATLVVSLGANMIGGLMPDIDEAASDIWDKIRWGHVIGKIIHPLLGQHRMISHSFLGMAIIGYLLKWILPVARSIVLVDMDLVWWSIMIGYGSHLLTDMLTTQGVPLLFPLPFFFGIPPLKFLRIKTGGFREKVFIFPGLMILNGYLLFNYHLLYEAFFKSYLK